MIQQTKKQEQAANDLIVELIDAVTDAYLNPPAGTADENGRMYLNLLAEEFAVTPIKIRKLLITSGAYRTPTSEYIGELFKRGLTVKEIQGLTGLSAASVSGYLPYKKTVYKLENTTKVATRLRRYRRRKALTEELKDKIEDIDAEYNENLLWETLTAFAGYPFITAKGLGFTYTVKGNEMFFSRKEKSVTRVSVNKAFNKAMRYRQEGTVVTGSKMLGCFGASYLYPVFIRIGVICDGEKNT